MRRCFSLARKAGKNTKNNPKVGAVLVYDDRIIGEGFHEKYGEAHAEVNCLKNVDPKDRHLIKEATLYVSLEPCCIERKTPACTNLILENGIKNVVVSTMDPNPDVAGKGLQILEEKGISITRNILKNEGDTLIRPFVTNLQKRPYVILKFAKTEDGFIGNPEKQILISSAKTNMLVHKWRSELDGIMIGTNTAIIDDPSLTVRHYFGENPTRIVLDSALKIPLTHQLWSDAEPTWFITSNTRQNEVRQAKEIIPFIGDNFSWDRFLKLLFKKGIHSLMIEGGRKTLNSIIEHQLWNEARIITAPKKLETGVRAPVIIGHLHDQFEVEKDRIDIVFNHMNVN